MTDDLRWILPLIARSLGDLPVVIFLRGRGSGLPTLWVSPGIEEITGYSRSLFTADPPFWIQRVHPEDRPGVVRRLRSLGPDETAALRYRLHLPGDRVRWLREELRADAGPGGTVRRYVGVVRSAEEEVRAGERVENLEERIRRAERGESLGGLAAGIAHDFNNLLTAILSTVQLARDDLERGEVREEDLGIIEQSARRGTRLVRQIVGFAGRSRQEPRPIDLGEVVEETLSLLRRSLGEDVRVAMTVPEELWPVEADPALVEQVVVNLAVNARDAMPDGGRLEITLGNEAMPPDAALERYGVLPGPFVRLTVRDTGTGIPPEALDRVFEPYFSTKGGDRVGAGIGLATVKRIAREHGGGVEVESRRGIGTSVHVVFPRAGAAVRDRRTDAGAAGVVDRRLRILLVDDDPGLRTAAARALRRAGHEVIEAGTGMEAIGRVGSGADPPDLLITDVVLPDRDGGDLHRILDARIGGLPVLFISGYSSAVVEERADLPSDAPLLPKPFDPGELEDAIARVLSGESGGRGRSRDAG